MADGENISVQCVCGRGGVRGKERLVWCTEKEGGEEHQRSLKNFTGLQVTEGFGFYAGVIREPLEEFEHKRDPTLHFEKAPLTG